MIETMKYISKYLRDTNSDFYHSIYDSNVIWIEYPEETKVKILGPNKIKVIVYSSYGATIHSDVYAATDYFPS